MFRSKRLEVEPDIGQKLLSSDSGGIFIRSNGEYVQAFDPYYKLLSLVFYCVCNRHDASHDPLTGLANRRSFDEFLKQFSFQALRYDWIFSLIILDVDNFKELNDTKGHAFGDLIKRIGNRN